MYWNHFRVPNINGTGVTAEVIAFSILYDSVKIDTLGNSSVYNSSFQGVNSTFFGTDLLGIAINNGQVVRTGGDRNGTATNQRTRSTMYRRKDTGAVGISRVHLASSLPGGISNMHWAVGGLGLYLDQNLTFNQYNTKLVDDEGSSGVGGTSDRRPRTMMGYIPNGNGPGKHIIVLAIAIDYNDRTNNQKGIRFYDGRMIMSGLGCTQAIHLDGGKSTSIRLINLPEDRPTTVVRYQADSNAKQKAIVRANYSSSTGSHLLSTNVPGFIDIE